MSDITPEPQLNRAGRRAQARTTRMRRAGAAMATIPAAFGTTALLLGATASPAGASTLTVTKLADTNDGVCDSDCSLREAVDVAADGDTIDFQTGLTGEIALSLGTIPIDTGVTISGPGAAVIQVDGGGSTRIFRVNTTTGAQTVTISDLTLQDGSASEGGAIAVDDDDDLVITGVTFLDNSAGYGGAIYVSGNEIDVTITGSTFNNNYAEYYGGAIAVDSGRTLTITGSAFTGNTAGEYQGGAIYVDYLAQDLKITDSQFTGNYAEEEGGAIAVDDAAAVIISGSTFTENSADSDGGAIAIDSVASVTITDSDFVDNSANSDGGAIYLDSAKTPVVITGSTFTRNTADTDGGAVAVNNASTFTLDSSTFTDNTAGFDGGALYLDDGAMAASITGSTFTGNHGSDGGAINVNYVASFAMSTSSLSGNHAHIYEGDNYSGSGGGVYFDRVVGAASITDSTISDNHADREGGGIFVGLVGDGLTVANSTISGNTAVGEGGGIFVDWVDDDGTYTTSGVRLLQSTVAANAASTIGGVAVADTPELMSLSRKAADAEPAEDVNRKHPEKADDVEPAETDVSAQAPAGARTVVVDGTIVALNSGADLGSLGITATAVVKSSLFGAVTGLTLTDQGGNLQGVDPLLGPLQDNGGPTQTRALLDGSPAVNAGPIPVADFPDNQFDQRGAGYDRVVGGQVDIGAFEVQPTNIEPNFTG